MPAGAASDRRRSGYRLAAREVPAPWVAAAAVVALGLLLFAGGGPLRPALATFALGSLAALALTWLHGAAARHRARRRAEAAHAAVMREGLARLRAGRTHSPRTARAAGERSPRTSPPTTSSRSSRRSAARRRPARRDRSPHSSAPPRRPSARAPAT
jgi:hypothetical protein